MGDAVLGVRHPAKPRAGHGNTSLLISQGLAMEGGAGNRVQPVNETDCRTLIEIAEALNQDEVSPAQEFLIGTDTPVNSSNWQAEEALLKAKASAGARILYTGLCLDAACLRAFMQRLVDSRLTWNFSTIVGLAALPSYDVGRSLMERRPGTRIPEAVLERLASARDPEREGVAICAELIQEVSTIPGISGVRLLSLENPENCLRALDRSGCGN